MDARDATDDPRVAVCVCTYRRPAQLDRLLKSLLAIERPPSTFFVIVDNDGNDPEVARLTDAFRQSSGSRVEYAVECRPGISAARNRAIALARALGAESIAMLDDDECASPQWLARLLETRGRTGARIVGGAVQPVFPEGRENLERYKRLWSVAKAEMHGRTYVYCTCNCLIDVSTLAIFGDAPFDERFGLSGGEDAVFFRRLFFDGVAMAWSDDAVLFEEYAYERASLSWMRRRWYRQGNVGVMCERAAPDPKGIPPLARTILLAARLPFYPLVHRRGAPAPLLWLLEAERIRGRFARHLGIASEQYARADGAPDKACR